MKYRASVVPYSLSLFLFLTGLALLLSPSAIGGITRSDDFNARNLARPLWTIVDPFKDGAIRMVGAGTDSAMVQIYVPGGVDHDIYSVYGDRAPRIMQNCTNTDFDISAGFRSAMFGSGTSSFQIQGILVQADANNFIRFDFVSGNMGGAVKDSMWVQAISFTNGINNPFPRINPKYVNGFSVSVMDMRIKRTGNIWKMYYTFGGPWVLADSFSFALNVTKIGLWAGNAGPFPMPFTAKIDFFRDLTSPFTDDAGAVVDSLGPYIHNVKTIVNPNGFAVQWKTDEPADGVCDWGLTTSYGNQQSHPGYYYDHRLITGGVGPNTTSHFRISGVDAGARSGNGGDMTFFSGDYVQDTKMVSDDFLPPSLNTTLWEFVNPKGDATQAITNKQLAIAVPGGTAHEIWGGSYGSPRIMQNVQGDPTFWEAVVKFNTPLVGSSTNIMSQGVVLEEDPNSLVRLDYYYNGTSVYLFVASWFQDINSTPDIYANESIPVLGLAPPLYMKIAQGGIQIRVYWSLDGVTWNLVRSFNRPLLMKRFGVYAGNAGSSPQAFTGLIDLVKLAVPARPGLVTPASNAINVLTPATLTWDTTASATQYRLQVSTDAGFGTTAFDDSSITATTKQVPSLSNLIKYYWRVRGKNSLAGGAWSDAFAFTTAMAPPAAPSPLAPADNAADVDTSVKFRWSKPATATTYRLQVGTDSTFATGIVYNDSTLTDTTKVVGNGLLSHLTKYFWRVNAKNAGGTSAYSTLSRFTTASPIPPAPILVAPPNGAANQQPNVTLRWNKARSAATYQLQVATDSLFGTIVFDNATLTDTSGTMSGLANSTKHYWRVRAKNAAGTGPYSTVWSFTTIVAIPGAPTLLTPANNALNQDLNTKLTWRRVAVATTYRVQVATDSNFATGIALNDSTVTDSTKTVSGLVYNQKYYWRVNGKNIAGTGTYSSVWNFRTYDADPAIPRQLAPANNATGLDTMVTLRWSKPTGATSYTLKVATDSGMASGVVFNGVVVDTTRILHNLNFLTKYWWQVNADGISGPSPFSSKWNFTTGIPLAAQVILVAPKDLAPQKKDSVVLRWRKSGPLADKYFFEIAIDTLFQFKVADSTADTSVVRTGLILDQKYFWRVRARNAAGLGPFSEIRRFVATLATGVADRYGVPTQFELSQNYPNPFNPATKIEFALPRESQVKLEIFNLLGERVATLVDEVRTAGYHSVSFSAADLPSGLYLYRIAAGDFVSIRKMMLVK